MAISPEEAAAIEAKVFGGTTPTTIRVGPRDVEKPNLFDAAGVPPVVKQNINSLGEDVGEGLVTAANFAGDVARESAESFIPDTVSSAAALTAMSAIPAVGELGWAGRGAMALGKGIVGAATKFGTDALTREAQDIVGSSIFGKSVDEPFTENLSDAAFDTVFGLNAMRKGVSNPAVMSPQPGDKPHSGLFVGAVDRAKKFDPTVSFDNGIKTEGKAIFHSPETYIRDPQSGRMVPVPKRRKSNDFEGMAKEAEAYSFYKTQQRDDFLNFVENNREGVVSPSSVDTVWTFKKPDEVQRLMLEGPNPRQLNGPQIAPEGSQLPDPRALEYTGSPEFIDNTNRQLSTFIQAAPETAPQMQGIKESIDFLEGTAQTITTPTKRYAFGSVKGYQEAIQKLQGHIRELGGYDPKSPYSTFVKSLEGRIRLYKRTLAENIDKIIETNLASQTADANLAKIAGEARARGLKPSDLYEEYNASIHNAMGIQTGLYASSSLKSQARAELGKLGGEASTADKAMSFLGGSSREDARRLLTNFGSEREAWGVRFLYDNVLYEPTIFERSTQAILDRAQLFGANLKEAMKKRFLLQGVTKQTGIEGIKAGIPMMVTNVQAEELATMATEEMLQALKDPIGKKQAMQSLVQQFPELFAPAPGGYQSYFDGRLQNPMEQEVYIDDVYSQDIPAHKRAELIGNMLAQGKIPQESPQPPAKSPIFTPKKPMLDKAIDMFQNDSGEYETDADRMVSTMEDAKRTTLNDLF